MPPEPPLAPGAFLGPQEALGAFRSLQQPWVLSQTQGPCFPCFPHPLLPLPPHTLSLPGLLGPSLELQEALGAFGSLWQPSVFSQTQGACSPCSPLSPSPPHPCVSLGPFDLPWALGSLGSLWKPFAALGLQSDSGALFPLFPLTPPCYPLLPLAS